MGCGCGARNVLSCEVVDARSLCDVQHGRKWHCFASMIMLSRWKTAAINATG